MTERERQFAALGLEYTEGIEDYNAIIIPNTDRYIYKRVDGRWDALSYTDNTLKVFDDLLDAVKYSMPPTIESTDSTDNAREILDEIIDLVESYRDCDSKVYNFNPIDRTPDSSYEIGVCHGERLLADSIKAIINGRVYISKEASFNSQRGVLCDK